MTTADLPAFTTISRSLDSLESICSTDDFANGCRAVLLRDEFGTPLLSINGTRPFTLPQEDAESFVVNHGTFADRLKLTNDSLIDAHALDPVVRREMDEVFATSSLEDDEDAWADRRGFDAHEDLQDALFQQERDMERTWVWSRASAGC